MFCSHWCLAVTARYGGYDPGYDPGLIWFSTHFSEVAEVFTEICWLPETCTETSDVSIDLTCRTFFVQKVLKYIKKNVEIILEETVLQDTTGTTSFAYMTKNLNYFELRNDKKWHRSMDVHGFLEAMMICTTEFLVLVTGMTQASGRQNPKPVRSVPISITA